VKVIMERLAGDLRAAQYPVADERRLVRTRRIRQGEVALLGYTISIVLTGEFLRDSATALRDGLADSCTRITGP